MEEKKSHNSAADLLTKDTCESLVKLVVSDNP